MEIYDKDRLNELLFRLDKQLNKWSENINEWFKNEEPFTQNSSEQNLNVLSALEETLTEMFDGFKSYGVFKDKWSSPESNLSVFGFSQSIDSLKTNIQLSLGLDYKGVYLQTSINNARNIKNMSDEFWALLVSLKDYGSFEFYENAVSPSWEQDYQYLFRTYKNNLFRFMRNYFLFEIENKEESDINEMGWWRIRWDFDYSIDQIFAEACLVFKTFYRMNYLLWKVDELRSQKELKKG